jgi:hypothetical protein
MNLFFCYWCFLLLLFGLIPILDVLFALFWNQVFFSRRMPPLGIAFAKYVERRDIKRKF